MKNVYEVLRQKELEKSRLETEVVALRVAASLLLAAGEAEDCSHADIAQFACTGAHREFEGGKPRSATDPHSCVGRQSQALAEPMGRLNFGSLAWHCRTLLFVSINCPCNSHVIFFRNACP